MKAQTIAYGVWQEQPCTYCGKDIQATSDVKNAPYWLPALRAWSHAECYRARGKEAVTEAQAGLFDDGEEEAKEA
jgi:hypothetical protein